MNKRCSLLTHYFLTYSFILAVSLLSAQSAGAKDSLKVISTPITSLKCNTFTFDATASHDPDEENISFFWDFGDGQTSTEPMIEHTYAASGDYQVMLSITDNTGLQCSTARVAQTVRVNIPPYATFSSEDAACVNTEITLDAAGSYDDSKGKLSYSWNFGDGTSSTGQAVRKAYAKGGNYKVDLTVNDNSGTVCNETTTSKIIRVNAPPVAEAGDAVLLKCAGDDNDFSVSFSGARSSDINNDQLSYVWDFGDGSKKEGKEVTHTYEQVGNYDVKLIVKDDTQLGCGIGVDFVTVRLNKAPKANAGEDIVACPGDEVIFDGTSSYAHTKGTLGAQWFFGDGQTATGLRTSHVYDKPGVYQSNLTVENRLNAMCPPSRDAKTVTINSMPTVSIKTKPKICLGETAHFDASSATDADGDNLDFYWSFGDGTILRSGSKVSHDYKQGGNYKVTVIADDGKNSKCSTATATADVLVNTPPVADAGPNLSCCVDQSSSFNASASTDPDGNQLSYLWDFGDGTQARGTRVDHTFVQSGSYNVTLTVNDNTDTSCSSSTAGFVAEVNTTPVPVIKIH